MKVLLGLMMIFWIVATVFVARKFTRGIRDAKPNRDDGTANRNTT